MNLYNELFRIDDCSPHLFHRRNPPQLSPICNLILLCPKPSFEFIGAKANNHKMPLKHITGETNSLTIVSDQAESVEVLLEDRPAWAYWINEEQMF